MDIKLKERQVVELKNLEIKSTFKIDGSSFVFMKIDVEGLAVLKDQTSIKVLIPEGKVPVICLNTGQTRFIALDEKVQIVTLEVNEVLK